MSNDLQNPEFRERWAHIAEPGWEVNQEVFSRAGRRRTKVLHCAIPFTQAITLSAGSMTLDASGSSVVLDGQSKTRLFDMKGGTLTLVDLTLQNGAATGAAGAPGAKGS